MGRGGIRIPNPNPGSGLLKQAASWGGVQATGHRERKAQAPDRLTLPSDPPARSPIGEEGVTRRDRAAAIAPSPSPGTAPPAAATAFLGPGRPGRRRRRRCEADGGPGRPPPRRRGSQWGGVCAPRDPSSETPRGPLAAPCLRRLPSPRTRPPTALRLRAPRRDADWSPEAASPASRPRGAPQLAPNHPCTPAPWSRAKMFLTSLWPLTGQPSPPTPAPTPNVCPLLFSLRARSSAPRSYAGPAHCQSHAGFPNRHLVASQACAAPPRTQYLHQEFHIFPTLMHVTAFLNPASGPL